MVIIHRAGNHRFEDHHAGVGPRAGPFFRPNLPGVERANRNYAFVVPFVAALAELGLRHVCISPGSRSTPLALSFAADERIHDHVHLDERSAAFYALGMAKTTGLPVALVCTSGTAAAEYHPAAAEARQARVPLLLLTADRPAELRDAGAPQTIDQVGLYGRSVKWFHDVGAPVPDAAFFRTAPALAGRAWAAALDAPAGPVHLNFRFRDPLHPATVPGDAPDPGPLTMPAYRPGILQPPDAVVAEVAGLIAGRRTMIVAGPQRDPALAGALAGLATSAGFPALADALSGLRCGRHDLAAVVAHGAALAGAGLLDRLRPEAVVRVGAQPTSKAVFRWLAEHPDVPQILIEPAGWRDPDGAASLVVRADPAATIAALTKALAAPAPADWLAEWRKADELAARTLTSEVEAAGFPSEPGVVAALGRALPAGARLWAASSMPVRDVDTFLPRRAAPLRVLANRGANGIDGLLSSAFGSALADPSPTYVLAGDLSALHDLTGLAAAARLGAPATAVVVDNDGGGIFHFLPQAELAEFERLFGTPHGTDLVAVANALGVPAEEVGDAGRLEELVADPPSGPRLALVRTERAANATLHRAIEGALAAALDA